MLLDIYLYFISCAIISNFYAHLYDNLSASIRHLYSRDINWRRDNTLSWLFFLLISIHDTVNRFIILLHAHIHHQHYHSYKYIHQYTCPPIYALIYTQIKITDYFSKCIYQLNHSIPTAFHFSPYKHDSCFIPLTKLILKE